MYELHQFLSLSYFKERTILFVSLLKDCKEMKLNLLSGFEIPKTNCRVTLRLMKKEEHLDSFGVDVATLIILCVGRFAIS